MKMLIIGSSGGIARRIIPMLREVSPKLNISGIDLVNTADLHLDSFIPFDLRNLNKKGNSSQKEIRNALRSADVVVLLAAAVHNNKLSDKEFHTMNAIVPNVLYNIYRDERGREGHFIFFSTIAVYGDHFSNVYEASKIAPVTPYAKTKSEAECKLLEAKEVDNSPLLTIVRSATVINSLDRGNLTKLIRFAKKRRIFFTVKKGIEKSFVDVNDLGILINKIIQHRSDLKSCLFNAAGPKVDLKEILNLVSFVTRPLIRLPFPISVLSHTSPSMTNSVSVNSDKTETQFDIKFNSFREAFLREFSDIT